MNAAHHVFSKDFKVAGAPSTSGVLQFSEESRISDADLAEDLLASQTLEEILHGVPTMRTLVPESVATFVVSVDSVPDDVASYASPDSADPDVPDPDDGDVEPTEDAAAIVQSSAPSSAASIMVRAGTVAKVRRAAGMRATKNSATAVPGVSRGKDIRREFQLRVETALWSDRTVYLHDLDLVKVMEAFPAASSVEMAKSAEEHFEVTRSQATALRRRFASMVAVEQNLVARVRRLFPVAATPKSAMTALRRIQELCECSEQRRTALPFE